MLCMRSRLQPNAGSQRIPRTAQQLKSEQKAVDTMCLPTPLTVANSPSRDMRDESYPRASTSTVARSNQQARYGYKRSDNSMEQMRDTQGRCLRTPNQLQANIRKQYPNEASQQEESNATTLTSIGAVYHRQSKKIRSRNISLYAKADLYYSKRRRTASTVASRNVIRYSDLNRSSQRNLNPKWRHFRTLRSLSNLKTNTAHC
ncbi:translocase of chloroplast 90, chloroplastic [Dorcoceras hygrometricum]|uniref:Translocase of chloroplast 90, chloroplastic n=1 Tax=Dorcoceras hygrometricum TaxID=472368 RepID=A0A2Z7CBX5_9LAMI|nr:translocase of chloroplast 90, chloroplastic [Dorcoceras hygrometricum]